MTADSKLQSNVLCAWRIRRVSTSSWLLLSASKASVDEKVFHRRQEYRGSPYFVSFDNAKNNIDHSVYVTIIGWKGIEAWWYLWFLEHNDCLTNVRCSTLSLHCVFNVVVWVIICNKVNSRISWRNRLYQLPSKTLECLRNTLNQFDARHGIKYISSVGTGSLK